MNSKIGIGIITCNRPEYFSKLLDSLPDIENIVVVNDGKPYENQVYSSKIKTIIQHQKNRGVGKSKNDALKYLLANKCKHIFLFEDDIALKNTSLLEKYIKAGEVSGILHFNYAYHGKLNRNDDGSPKIRKIIKYNDINIALHFHLTGALSYFKDEVLKNIGLIDERYKNILEHVDHTYQIIKYGYHPPFRWFADLEDSFTSIQELDIYFANSIINPNNKRKLKYKIYLNYLYFALKNGCRPSRIPLVDDVELVKELEKIRKAHSIV